MAIDNQERREAPPGMEAPEEYSFDDVARGLADGSFTRGQALKYIGSALLGGLSAMAGISAAAGDADAKKKKKHHAPPVAPLPPIPTPTPSLPGFTPAQGAPWQWQLTIPVDTTVNVPTFEIDLFDNAASVVSTLHSQGKKVICYLSAGSWENFRPDASRFPESVKGKPLSGFPDERWLDIRQINTLAPIMQARLDQCQSKGFDAVEADNVDGYKNDTGFPLTANDQLTYNKWFADQAHQRGLGIALKNDVDQITELQPFFNFAVNEQCFEFNECNKYQPFIAAGKAVLHVEYNLSTSQFCPQARALHFSSMKKNLDLDAPREPC
jgi:hypothetical protein